MSKNFPKNQSTKHPGNDIRIRGARQNNLKNLNLDIHTHEMTVVTGPSGSGKSSLVFDTLYAEGQRRYVETFSAYARQFLDRMDKPAVDAVEGVPPAIAIDQTNPVRTSRSTLGTMTELNDHFKLLFARAAHLFDRETALPVQHDTIESVQQTLVDFTTKAGDPRLVLTFPVELPVDVSEEEIEQWLSVSGFSRVQARHQIVGSDGKTRQVIDVVADRFRLGNVESGRVAEAIETAFKRAGRLNVYALGDDRKASEASASSQILRFSSGLHCPQSNISYAEPNSSLFSFNSPYGACETCRGFGRVIGVDWGLVIPDEKKTLRGGAVKPIQTPAWVMVQDDMMRYAANAGIPRDTPWSRLTQAQKKWVIDGAVDFKDGNWEKQWYGIRRFFEYLESKSYKMHIRVLLSKYRSYTPCPACHGARLKSEALLWRIGSKEQADAVLSPDKRFLPSGVNWNRAQLEALPGLTLHDLMLLPIERLQQFIDLVFPATAKTSHDDPLQLLYDEIRTRLRYLCDVGIGYLTLDRQSRTLSGGEVQRINLTTALGTSLVNTLFVLDEPSIGLHPRDMERITRAMHRLRNAGNTLVVVEHDPAVMFAADRVIDMGPGPGENGGSIVFDGTPSQLRDVDTLTGVYLGGRKHIGIGFKRLVTPSTPKLILQGVREHNLKNIDIELPLHCLTTVTGVSGSGKSTLIQDVLYPSLCRYFGKATEAPGLHDGLLGADWLADAVFVDQSPIGKTTRSNPASYVGAWDVIRQLFAQTPLARERGYTSSKFSFNSGDGRCPTCGGSGFEHVEMQFLSDVYLRCPDCNGQRYRPEVLEVRLDRGNKNYNVAQILDMTVSEAAQVFADDQEVLRVLQPIMDVGLEYVKLGQPVPTLSGGEAQRLKLAGFLAQTTLGKLNSQSVTAQKLAKKGTLFLFDEPTTGLHFDDIAKLMRAFRKLLDAGHSIVLIEHNLDVIRASDWLIDLGPEGGDHGGEIVCAGTPDEIKKCKNSYTGQALLAYEQSFKSGVTHVAENAAVLDFASPGIKQSVLQNDIEVINAREHNLKALNVNIPRDQFNVITGVSGSGKSTLAFDIIFGEGQRRYLESLNAYARSIVQPASRAEVDAVYGIPPTVAIEQRLSRGGQKSTVGTATEVWHYLRLLYVKLGVQHCIYDGVAVLPQTAEKILAQLMSNYRGRHIGLLAPLVTARKGIYTELAAWANNHGYPYLRVDGEFVPTTKFPRLDRYKEHSIELPIADIHIYPENEAFLHDALRKALEHGKGIVYVLDDLTGLKQALLNNTSTAKIGHLQVFSTLRACPVCGTSYPELDPRLFSYNSKHGWCPDCVGTGKKLDKTQRKAYDDSLMANDDRGREQSFAEPEVEGVSEQACPTCYGTRLNAQAMAVMFAQTSITDLAQLSVSQMRAWFDQLHLNRREAQIARDLVPEIKSRLDFLEEVGLGYLTLDRGAPSLSGGESQRIRLAAQLGSNLQGVCYVLDEPTIGLHPRDNRILLGALHSLSRKGNTLLVVEHDEETIRAADHIIDIGPGAGSRGGRLIAQGSAKDLEKEPDSLTGRYLAHPIKHPKQPHRPVQPGKLKDEGIFLRDACLHNLQHVDLAIPLKRLVAITGVSGSGKSTLARDVLLANLSMAVNTKKGEPHWSHCSGIDHFDRIDRVLEVDQTPIGKTPRSCPATYVGFWDTVRKLFAETLEAKARGYGPGRFSFNTGEGRCPACAGQGMRTIEMNFLPDVKVPCEVCHGVRFNPETLAVTWRGKNIGEVLQMEVDEAVEFFASMPNIAHPLQLLQDVGLGYLTLGQPSPTLSGGEAQRIKLITELSKVHDDITRRGNRVPHTFYVLDEPTVGLHMSDIEKLIGVLHRLTDAGHSVLVIEHDLDVIAEADWVIDMGPEGGNEGGRVVATGTPEALVKTKGSHTGEALVSVLNR